MPSPNVLTITGDTQSATSLEEFSTVLAAGHREILVPEEVMAQWALYHKSIPGSDTVETSFVPIGTLLWKAFVTPVKGKTEDTPEEESESYFKKVFQ